MRFEPGWYPDPEPDPATRGEDPADPADPADSGPAAAAPDGVGEAGERQRWWDGEEWTDRVRPDPGPSGAAWQISGRSITPPPETRVAGPTAPTWSKRTAGAVIAVIVVVMAAALTLTWFFQRDKDSLSYLLGQTSAEQGPARAAMEAGSSPAEACAEDLDERRAQGRLPEGFSATDFTTGCLTEAENSEPPRRTTTPTATPVVPGVVEAPADPDRADREFFDLLADAELDAQQRKLYAAEGREVCRLRAQGRTDRELAEHLAVGLDLSQAQADRVRDAALAAYCPDLVE